MVSSAPNVLLKLKRASSLSSSVSLFPKYLLSSIGLSEVPRTKNCQRKTCFRRVKCYQRMLSFLYFLLSFATFPTHCSECSSGRARIVVYNVYQCIQDTLSSRAWPSGFRPCARGSKGILHTKISLSLSYS